MGFEICAISLDPDPERIRHFVADNQLLWLNTMNRSSDNSVSVADSYGVHSIPTNFLISPEGIIVEHNLHDEHLAHELQHRVAGEVDCSYPQLHNNHDVIEEGEK